MYTSIKPKKARLELKLLIGVVAFFSLRSVLSCLISYDNPHMNGRRASSSSLQPELVPVENPRIQQQLTARNT